MKIAITGASVADVLALRQTVINVVPSLVYPRPDAYSELEEDRWRMLFAAVDRHRYLDTYRTDNFVASQWGLDDVGHQGVWMASQIGEFGRTASPLLAPGGAAVLGPAAMKQQIEIGLAQSVLSVVVEMMREELEYWDLMFWKPLAGVQPSELDYDWSFNLQVASVLHDSNIPGLERVVELPVDLDEAKQRLSEVVQDRVSSS